MTSSHAHLHNVFYWKLNQPEISQRNAIILLSTSGRKPALNIIVSLYSVLGFATDGRTDGQRNGQTDGPGRRKREACGEGWKDGGRRKEGGR